MPALPRRILPRRILPRRILISASSDIGRALAEDWLGSGCEVHGTFRTRGAGIDELERAGARLTHCDLASAGSIAAACDELRRAAADWDVLVLAAGSLDPVGPFAECDFAAWSASLTANFIAQMHVLHELLPARRRGSGLSPLALFFAGGGANNATVNYSAYTLAKIALTKAVELLDAELPDCRFAILGPGWVKTKIHEATLQAGERAGANYRRTLDKLARDECVPMELVVECCNWLVGAERHVIGGRNFSAVYDAWGDPRLDEMLRGDRDMYKLRRAGNAALVVERSAAALTGAGATSVATQRGANR
jgi:NAD(P)-dependent dehydrogenase (short-subunit alcohol dehydrogenase family)